MLKRSYEQPSALFIQNVGYLAQMLLQKMQGEDGRLEVLGLLEGDQQITRAERLAPLIRTMIAIGATVRSRVTGVGAKTYPSFYRKCTLL